MLSSGQEDRYDMLKMNRSSWRSGIDVFCYGISHTKYEKRCGCSEGRTA